MIPTAFIIGMVMGLAQIFKAFGVPNKYIPLVNIMSGIMLCILFDDHNLLLKLRIFNGILVGLSASGLFSGIKNIGKDL